MREALDALENLLRDELTPEQKREIRYHWAAVRRAARREVAIRCDLTAREKSAREQLRITLRQLEQTERELAERG